MEDLRTRIALRKQARRKKMFIRLGVLAAVIAVIAIICVSCNSSKSEQNIGNNIVTTDVTPSPTSTVPVSEIPAE